MRYVAVSRTIAGNDRRSAKANDSDLTGTDCADVWMELESCALVVECERDRMEIDVHSPYSSVVEHSLRKRKVGGSIPPGGSLYRCHFNAVATVHHTHGHISTNRCGMNDISSYRSTVPWRCGFDVHKSTTSVFTTNTDTWTSSVFMTPLRMLSGCPALVQRVLTYISPREVGEQKWFVVVLEVCTKTSTYRVRCCSRR